MLLIIGLITVVSIGVGIGLLLGSLFFNNKKLLNRPQLREIISKALNKNDKDNKFILFLINLNNFHSTIEAFGYKIGNNIIEHNKIKISDYAKKHNAVFYYVGFDEYVIFYQNVLFDHNQIINIATELLEIISQPVQCGEMHVHITASIGVGIFPDHASNSDLLLRRVEVALLDAKKSGKNTYSIYNSDLTNKIVDFTIINSELLTALNNEELQLSFQPQVDIKTGVLVGAEALVRWTHSTKGSISPEIFIDIAEQSGLIFQVGAWIIKQACIQAKFLSQELGVDDFKIAINLSNGQFLQGDVVRIIAQAIYDTGVKPQNIEIELTESMFMVNVEKNLLMLSVLVAMGVKIAIDDFGTGYSSFKRLRQLKWHYIKIDQSFIKKIDFDKQNYAIVNAMINMAKNLDIKVIAEGVETEQELAVLRKIDCDIMQGYYVSKPLPITEFITFAKNMNKVNL